MIGEGGLDEGRSNEVRDKDLDSQDTNLQNQWNLVID